jgi:hypothetical protein
MWEGDLRVAILKTLKSKILKSCYRHREVAEKLKKKMSKNWTIFLLKISISNNFFRKQNNQKREKCCRDKGYTFIFIQLVFLREYN